jgi:hypothetical protein
MARNCQLRLLTQLQKHEKNFGKLPVVASGCVAETKPVGPR